MRGVLSLEFLGDQSPLGDENFLHFFFPPEDERVSFPIGVAGVIPSPRVEPTRKERERGEVVIKWIQMLGGDLPAFLRVLGPRLPRLRIWGMRVKAGEIQRFL